MKSRKEVLRTACGVTLWKTELVHDGVVAATAYILESLRTPEKPAFNSLAEADAAYLKEVGLSEESELVARRLRRL
jgi:hypothetical protein